MNKNYILEPVEVTFTDAGLSKNITHNDHPYNAVERIRSKLKQKAEQGESDDGSSSGGSGINILHAEPKVVNDDINYIAITDVNFEDSPAGEDEARAFLDDLATKPSVVVWTYESVTNFCWVVLVIPDQTMIQTICSDNNMTQVQLMPFALTAIDGTLSFAFIVS